VTASRGAPHEAMPRRFLRSRALLPALPGSLLLLLLLGGPLPRAAAQCAM
jgi:hypothetical protein